MSQVIATALKEMKVRQKELQPLRDEYEQVDAAIKALESTDGALKAARKVGKAKSTSRRRGRPRKGEPTRAEQFFALVKKHPGVTISEAAKEMTVEPSSLYRVVAQLEEQKSIERRDRAIYPSVSAAG